MTDMKKNNANVPQSEGDFAYYQSLPLLPDFEHLCFSACFTLTLFFVQEILTPSLLI